MMSCFFRVFYFESYLKYQSLPLLNSFILIIEGGPNFVVGIVSVWYEAIGSRQQRRLPTAAIAKNHPGDPTSTQTFIKIGQAI